MQTHNPVKLAKALRGRLRFIDKHFFMKKDITLEIRASEGGTDSKLLVHDMRDIYIKAAKNNNFN